MFGHISYNCLNAYTGHVYDLHFQQHGILFFVNIFLQTAHEIVTCLPKITEPWNLANLFVFICSKRLSQ